MEKVSYKLWWNSSDGQSDMDGGDFNSEEKAEAAIPEWADELISYCDEEEQKKNIQKGSFLVEEIKEGHQSEVKVIWFWNEIEILREWAKLQAKTSEGHPEDCRCTECHPDKCTCVHCKHPLHCRCHKCNELDRS